MRDFVSSGDGAESRCQAGDAQNLIYPDPFGVGCDGAGNVGIIQRVQQGQDAGHWRQFSDGSVVMGTLARLRRCPVVVRSDALGQSRVPVVGIVAFGRADSLRPDFDGKMQALLLVNLPPCLIIRRFRIGQKAVAVKNRAQKCHEALVRDKGGGFLRYNDSMSKIIVRLAKMEDFPRVTALLTELGRQALTPETTEAVQAVYARHIGDPETASLVAEWNGEIVGFLSLIFRERLNHDHRQAWIPDLIVTELARGQGFGRALLERAFALATERGCDRVTLESGYARTVAHQVYEAVGMRNLGYYFTRPL